MLIDSCHLCSLPLWKKNIFCASCVESLLGRELIFRQQADLPVYSLCFYRNEVKEWILKCKKGEHFFLLHELSRILALSFARVFNEKLNGVIPVPSHSGKTLDHAGVMAQTLADFFDGSFEPFHLVSGKSEQKKKVLSERLQTRMALQSPLSKTSSGVWILADDVITTGATLSEAHKVLGRPPAVGLTLATRPYVLVG